MDKLELLLRGLEEVPNPKYKPQSKRSKEPPTITRPIGTKADTDAALSLGIKGGLAQHSIESAENEKYREYGIDWRPGKDMDTALANAQSNWNKFFNAVGQTLYSEIFLGTLKAGSDLLSGGGHAGAIIADTILQKVFDVKGDNIQNTLGMQESDFSNPISRKLEEWQEYYKNEVAPIYTTPGVDISNGGLGDFGWWMSNMPNIASSITLLLPARGATVGIGKLAGAIGKARKAAKVEKVMKNAEKYKTLTEAGKVTQAAKTEKELNAFQKFWYNPIQQERIKTAGKIGSDAILMRTIENYQESHQTYTDMYKDAAEYLEGMNDVEYNNFINKNREDFEANGINVNDRDAVAKRIAKRSADRTFLLDYSNTIFDVIQLYGLRNIGRVAKSVKSPSVLTAQEKSIQEVKQIGKKATAKTATGEVTKDAVKQAAEESTEVAGKKGLLKTIGTKVKNFATGTGKLIASESTEGIEEAVNYIAQQEGITLGNTLLGKETDATATGFWNRRLTDYLENAELWESAFWGVMGGVVFGAAGSAINRVQFNQEALSRKKKRAKNETTGEEIKSPDFITLQDAPEVARAKASINLRNTRLNDLINDLELLQQGYDPRTPRDKKTGEHAKLTGDIEAQQDRIRKDLITKYQSTVALESINSGTFDLLLDYFRADPVKQAMIDNGIIEESEADEFIKNTLSDLEDIRDVYNNELAYVNYQITALNASNRSSEPISLEYVQQIAKTNTENQLRIKHLDREISKLEQEANKEETFSGISAEQQLNNRRTIRVAQLTEVYARLEADKKAVKEDKTLDEWRRAESIADIEDYQQGILKSIKDAYSELGVYDSEGKLLKGVDTTTHQMAAILNAIQRGERHVKQADGSYARNMSKDLAVRTDEEIVKAYEEHFAGNTQEISTLSQLAKVINQDMLDSVSTEDSIYKTNAKLFDLYMNIGDLETTRTIYSRNINRTQSQIANKVDILHNRNNELRKELIFKADDTIRELHDKYQGTNEEAIERAVIKSFFNDKAEAERIARENLTGTDENGKSDAQKLIDALNILNFGQGANRQVFQYISGVLRKNAEKHREARENSTTSENQSSQPQITQTNNNTQPIQNSSTLQGNGQNGQVGQKSIVSNNKKVRIVVKNDGTITSITKQGGEVPIIEYSDGSIELNLSSASQQTQRKYINTELFDDPGSNILETNTSWHIASNPKLEYNEQSKQYNIVEKGQIQIVNTDTGEVVGGNEDIVVPETEQVAGENGVIINVQEFQGEEQEGNDAVIQEEGKVRPLSEAQLSSTGGAQQTYKPTVLSKENQRILISDTIGNFVDIFSDDADFTNVAQDTIAELKANHLNEFESEEAMVELVNEMVNELKEDYEDEMADIKDDDLSKSAANLTFQARYEEYNEAGVDFSEPFRKAVDAFVDEYIKIALIPEIDGKKAIRVRDLLRICGELNPSQDSTIINNLYGVLYSYLTSTRGKSKYYIIDQEDADSGKVITDALKSSEELRKETHKEQFVPQAINIKDFVQFAKEMEDQTYKDALNSLKVGDTLRMMYQDNGNDVRPELIFYKGDVKIGNMPLPYRDTNGGYIMYNSGWRTDVRIGEHGEVISNMMETVMDFFTYDSPECAHIRKLLIKASKYATNDIPQSLIDEFANNPVIARLAKESIDARNNGEPNLFFVEDEYKDTVEGTGALHRERTGRQTVNYRKIFGHLTTLWNYTYSTLNESTLSDNITVLKANTEAWFKKLHETYQVVSQQIEDKDVEITDISDGQIIHSVVDPKQGVDKAYKEANLVQDAASNLDNVRLAIGNGNGQVLVSDPSNFSNGKAIEKRTRFNDNNTLLAVYGRNTNPTFVTAFGVRVNDRASNENTELYTYATAARQALVDALSSYNFSRNSQAEFDKIEDILRSMFFTRDSNDRIPLFIQSKAGTEFYIQPIRNFNRFRGIEIVYQDRNTNTYKNIHILSHGNYGPGFGCIVDGKFMWASPNNFNKQKDVIVAIDRAVSNLINDHCAFNISKAGIRADSTRRNIDRGFIKRQVVNGESKVIIDIPTRVEQLSVNVQYDSYNDFVIQNNLIKVDLAKDEDGNNFANRADNQLFNQKLVVNLPYTTPIEKNDDLPDVDFMSDDDGSPAKAAVENHTDYTLPDTDEKTLDELKARVVPGNEERQNTELQSTRSLIAKAKDESFNRTVDELANSLGLEYDDIFPEFLTYYDDYNWYEKDENDVEIELGFIASAIIGEGFATINKYVNGKRSRRTVKAGRVVVGPKLLNMLASNNHMRRNQALRKLMHERLHQHLHNPEVDTNYVLNQLQGIYNEYLSELNKRSKLASNYGVIKKGYKFNADRTQVVDKDNNPVQVSKEELDELKTADKLAYLRYMLNHMSDEARLEEFAVEAITNPTVIEFMNSIEVKDTETNEKKSLFSKILEFISNLFGIEINENSLMKKYMNTLQKLDISPSIEGLMADAEKIEQGEEISDEPTVVEKPDYIEGDILPDEFDDLFSAFDEGAEDFENDNDNPDIKLNSQVEEYTEDGFKIVPNIEAVGRSIPIEDKENFNKLKDNGFIEFKCF